MTAGVEELVTLTIDGVQVSVPKGTLVIRAAEQAGVMIPRFCDHPLLDPVGACRQCLVDVPDAGNGRGFPKPQASCTIEVAPGMVVNTQATSPVAAKAQAGIMEFLLVNHPLDCPVCDKGGECPLQNQAMSNGAPESRFSVDGVGQKRLYPKPIALSPQILLDRERCVLCARCTRFSEQISGDPLIALVERGALQQVGRYEDEPYFSYFSGNTIQICPVGALTSADYRFRSRPFDLVSSPAITEHDASGAVIRVDHRRGKVMRRLSDNDPKVNEEWITDKDRFAFAYERLDDRLTHPLIREDGELRPASWPEAFAFAARGLAAGSAAVLPGGRITLEDAYAYSKFARVALGTNDIDFRARRHSAEEAEFLAAHVAGVKGVTYADVESAASVLLVALEPEDEAGTLFLRLRKAVRARKLPIVAIAAHTTPGLRKLKATLIPTVPGAEVTALADITDLSAESVIIVGERAAEVPGLLSAVGALAQRSGARMAWMPRRAGDRGALDAGALAGLLPGGRPLADATARAEVAALWGDLPSAPGRDLEGIISAASKGEITGLVVGGVDPVDLPDPAMARAALQKAFVVSLELRASAVTESADVVFPIAPVSQRSGSYVNWEGRHRPFEAAMPGMNPMAVVSDTRILAGIAEELDKPLHFRSPAQAGAELADLGTWAGARPTTPTVASAGVPDGLVLSSWKQLIDDGRMQDGADELRACARPARAVVAASLAHALGITDGDLITVSGPVGELDLPIEIGDIVDSVVWAPASSPGASVRAAVGPAGCSITVRAALGGQS